jgi:hypothetical protein
MAWKDVGDSGFFLTTDYAEGFGSVDDLVISIEIPFGDLRTSSV